MRKVHLVKQNESVPESGVQFLPQDPVSPATNQLWINTQNQTLNFFNGTETQTISAASCIETIILGPTQIAEKKVILEKTPIFPEKTTLVPEGGLPQVYGKDFIIINGNEVTWQALGLEGFLEEGEEIYLSYFC